MKLYFAHNFNMRKEYRELELKLEKELGIDLFNPFYDDESRTTEMRQLDSGEVKKWHIVSAPELVARDLKNLAMCDGLFTFIESPSIGTTLEIANATLMKKEIYVVSEKYYNHPWIKVYAHHKYQTLEEFKEYINMSNNIKRKYEKETPGSDKHPQKNT